MALFVAYCAKADPTAESAPVANVGKTVFAKNGKALWLNLLTTKGTRPQLFCCVQPDIYSFLS